MLKRATAIWLILALLILPCYAESPVYYAVDANNIDGDTTITGDLTVNGNINTTGNDIGAAYGHMYYDTSTTIFNGATAISIANGTISSGSINSIYVADGSSLTVNETGTFNIDFIYNTGTTAHPARFEMVARYQATGGGHVVKLQMFNYTGGTWDNVTGLSTDFATATGLKRYVWILNDDRLVNGDQEDYVNGSGQTIVRIQHGAGVNGLHNFYVDYAELSKETLSLDTANTAVIANKNMVAGYNQNVTINAALGQFVLDKAGDYLFTGNLSMLAPEGTLIEGDIYVNNSTIIGDGFSRGYIDNTVSSYGATPLIGIISNGQVGDTIDVRIMTDISDTFIVSKKMVFIIQKLN